MFINKNNFIVFAIFFVFIQACSAHQHKSHSAKSKPYAQRDADAVSRVVMPGNYPDPSIVLVGDIYYLTHNTDDNNPGLPVWKSKDMMNWEKVTNVLDRHIGAVWAPDIIFYKNKFYIYFTVMRPSGDLKNYVVTADKAEGPWTQPVMLEVDGIDPGHIATPEGKRYIYMSKGFIAELDASGTKVVSPQRHVYDGWEIPKEWHIECFCAESPKLIYERGYYYLITAQGGTAGPATSHMAVAARSKNIDGPWENSPHNPVVHTWSREERWWSKGHGTLLRDKNGDWQMVYHAYEKDFLTLGRQVVVVPIVWTDDDWFHVGSSTKLTDVKGRSWKDDFKRKDISPYLAFLSKDNVEEDYRVKKGQLILKAQGEKIEDKNTLLANAEHKSYEIITRVSVDKGVTAGLTLYYNDQYNGGVAVDAKKISQLIKGNPWPHTIDKKKKSVWLKIHNDAHNVAMYYSYDGKQWEKFDFGMEISGFHHNTLGSFRSVRAGMFAFGKGEAKFDFFEYKGLD